MSYLITTRLLDPLKLQPNVKLKLQVPIPGKYFQGSLVSAFMQYKCPYSHFWCLESDCEDVQKCFVPTELIQFSSNISHGFINCPTCSNNDAFLVRTPNDWVICKKCIREEKLTLEDYQDVTASEVCISCSSSATLTELDGWFCTSCHEIKLETIYSYDITNIGIMQQTGSAKEGYLFDIPVILPGYEISFIVDTDNVDFQNFLLNSQNRFLSIGGGRSRGFGTLQIISVEEWEPQSLKKSDKFVLITPTLCEADRIGDFKKDQIISTNGKIANDNSWDSSMGKFTEFKQYALPGSTIHLKEPEDSGMATLVHNTNGYGSYISFNKPQEEE